MAELLLLLVAVAIGLGISKALDRAGDAGVLPLSMQHAYERNRPRPVDRG